jgi:hypothetical protein
MGRGADLLDPVVPDAIKVNGIEELTRIQYTGAKAVPDPVWWYQLRASPWVRAGAEALRAKRIHTLAALPTGSHHLRPASVGVPRIQARRRPASVLSSQSVSLPASLFTSRSIGPPACTSVYVGDNPCALVVHGLIWSHSEYVVKTFAATGR